MSSSLYILMGALNISSLYQHNYTSESPYREFPKFWTNSGLCPAGKITHDDISESLLSDAMQMNLLYISALPSGSITNLRIHWLLELIQFKQFTQSGVPIYDFSDLDRFLVTLEEMNLSPTIEFMANLSNIFIKNPNQNHFIWENLSYQVVKHYLDMFGAKKVLNWRFETWNEPDLLNYNKLNFIVEDYLIYARSLRIGLNIAGQSTTENLYFPLRGPAGLFKSQLLHPLCWSILNYCNNDLNNCPIDVITYHRKGLGENVSLILKNSNQLLKKIYGKYPNLKRFSISNDEADPISGWSKPREFQADVRYAVALVNIILEHWTAKLTNKLFINLETISHDNAFLSYHPYEFSQRTLLAHFRINNTNPPHSQFIQKPVYAAMGILSRLAEMASNVSLIQISRNKRLKILKTIASGKLPSYISWLIIPQEDTNSGLNYESQEDIILPEIQICCNKTFAFIVETIDQSRSNPAMIWESFKNPSYPNATIREAMRRHQGPTLHSTGILNNQILAININALTTPWLMLLRICSPIKSPLKTPENLFLTPITHNEVFLTWHELDASSVQCLKTYEVWFKMNNTESWINISSGWHLAFPSFHFMPAYEMNVNGYYKVRGIDIFNNTSLFSTEVQYIEIK